MGKALDNSRNWISVAGLIFVAAFVVFASQARAASYPTGGSTFSGSAEGWAVKSASCTVPLGLCSAAGAYDSTAGNPAGSLANSSQITLNVGGLFDATVVTESPEFKVGAGGAGTLNLQRQFAPGGLLTLTPIASYRATVVDKTAGTEAEAISETITAEAGFAGKGGAVTLVAGHTYAIRIDSTIKSSLASIGLLGESAIRFDNVSVTDSAGGGGGGGGGGDDGGSGGNGGSGKGSNELTDSRLLSLMQNSLAVPAVLKGKRLFVKGSCPAKVGRTCRVTVQGMLKKGKPVTAKRTAKIAKGKTKQLVLKVKPKFKSQVAAKKKLLFKETVRAGKAKTTVYKRLKLIRHS